MIEIELNNIKKSYGLKNILDGFNLEIKTGERVALIGQNGSGKTTILKIISKEENIDSGTINIRKGATLGVLKQIYENEKEDVLVKDFLYDIFKDVLEIEQKLRNLEEKMAIEKSQNELEKIIKKYGNLQEEFIAVGGYEIQEKFSKICSKFNIKSEMLKRNYNNLSGGEKTRVNLAKLLLKNPDILLLDEPTNHLDIDSLNFLEELINKYNGIVLVVSHDRYFLDKVITKTIYGFRGENVLKKVGKLSGGEKVRLILLKLIQKDINFLILDEPTNHIDIETRKQLEEALKEYPGTVLFVSHDRFFINKLATRILNIEDYKIKSYIGNYDDFSKYIM